MSRATFEYDVCLSFAGEDREYVEAVAAGLRKRDVRVFYDRYATVELWGKDLYEHLDYVYGKAASFCVLFVSAAYAHKVWPNHERKSAQDRAIAENREYILPARFDDTTVPGLRGTVGHVDLRHTKPSELVDFIVQKLATFTSENGAPGKQPHEGSPAPARTSTEAEPSTSRAPVWRRAVLSPLRRISPVAARRLPVTGLVAALATCITAIVVLLVIGTNEPHASTLHSGALALTVQPGWRPWRDSIAGLPLKQPITIAVADTRVSAGMLASPRGTPASLPSSLTSAYGSPGRDEIVALPLGRAKSYAWSSTRRGALSVVIAVTNIGEIAITCATADSMKFSAMQKTCRALCNTARIVGARAEYPGLPPHLSGRLLQALAARASSITSLLARSNARHLASRAAPLRQLVEADTEAAQAVATVSPPTFYTAPLSTLAKQLRQEAVLLRGLSVAASRRNKSDYESLRSRLQAHSLGSSGEDLAAVGLVGLPLSAIGLRRVTSQSPTHHRTLLKPSVSSVAPTTATQAPEPTYTVTPQKSEPTPAPRREPEIITSKPE